MTRRDGWTAKQLSRFTLPAVLIVASVAMIGGCQSTPAKAKPEPVTQLTPGPDGKVESRVLTVALRQSILNMMMRQTAVGDALPADARTPDFMETVVQSTQLQYPQVFRISPEQEKAFAAGKFDDAANKAKLTTLSEQVKAKQLRLSAVATSLLDSFRAGRLSGAELELAARLIGAQVGK